MPVFGAAGVGSFAFGAPKTEALQRTEDRAGDVQSSGGETVFGSSGMKRKEVLDPNNAQGKTNTSDSSEVGAEGPRQPAKRPLLRTRGGLGLFRNAMSDLIKTKVSPVKREGPPPPDRPHAPGPTSDVPPNPQDLTDLRKAEICKLPHTGITTNKKTCFNSKLLCKSIFANIV